MDNSTEGVTLYTGFISDLLVNYEDYDDTVCKALFDMAASVDLSEPTQKVSMQLYNDMCAWIETNLGPANIIKAGENIGTRAYHQMVASNKISDESSPKQILEALKEVADFMIQDPQGRGWTILEMENNRAVMRRTQTFNSTLQFGLLKSLVHRGQDVIDVEVSLIKSVKNGDEFDDYEILWTSK